MSNLRDFSLDKKKKKKKQKKKKMVTFGLSLTHGPKGHRVAQVRKKYIYIHTYIHTYIYGIFILKIISKYLPVG